MRDFKIIGAVGAFILCGVLAPQFLAGFIAGGIAGAVAVYTWLFREDA